MKRSIVITMAALGTVVAGAHASDPLSRPARLLEYDRMPCEARDGRGADAFEHAAGDPSGGADGELCRVKLQNRLGEVMTIQALGYSDAQLRAIAEHFARHARRGA